VYYQQHFEEQNILQGVFSKNRMIVSLICSLLAIFTRTFP
jgi:hypothetical protein